MDHVNVNEVCSRGPLCGDSLMSKLKCPQAVKCIICRSYLIVHTPFLPPHLFTRLWHRGIHSPEAGAARNQSSTLCNQERKSVLVEPEAGG